MDTARKACRNCLVLIDSKYCPDCGTPAEVTRIDRHYVIHEVEHGVFHLEKGFLYTAKELLLRPGHSIRKFLEGDRKKHYKPIGFVIVTSILYTLLSHYLEIETAYPKLDGNVNKVIFWITTHYSYSNLIEILFIAFAFQLFFWKRMYNYFEYLVAICYLTGQGMLFGCLSLILANITKSPVIHEAFPWIAILYTVWAMVQFFNCNSLLSYFKAILAYFSGFFMFWLAAVLFAQMLTVMKINL